MKPDPIIEGAINRLKEPCLNDPSSHKQNLNTES